MSEPRSAEWNAGYEVGHDEGESCRNADWDFALSEIAGVPDDVVAGPTAVAEWIVALRRERDAALGRQQYLEGNAIAALSQLDKALDENARLRIEADDYKAAAEAHGKAHQATRLAQPAPVTPDCGDAWCACHP